MHRATPSSTEIGAMIIHHLNNESSNWEYRLDSDGVNLDYISGCHSMRLQIHLKWEQ
jgi:hypothetical protein